MKLHIFMEDLLHFFAYMKTKHVFMDVWEIFF